MALGGYRAWAGSLQGVKRDLGFDIWSGVPDGMGRGLGGPPECWGMI